ncbi:hypothetical protein BaRGS_00026508 [Batillaria attramentaria]|uniref:Uncharacterized protein n=1 Tax=Batillaria attramentaria TaxID=370345 RepID=A0ABD0K625_9CAEN
MAVYWITEVLPLGVTALLPVIIFPMQGLLPASEVCMHFVKDIVMFNIGCLTFAVAVETSNLHRRVALRTLMLMGSNPRLLLLGFMLPTWFISMWISNTSAAAMMIPIVTAVLSEIRETRIKIPHTWNVGDVEGTENGGQFPMSNRTKLEKTGDASQAHVSTLLSETHVNGKSTSHSKENADSLLDDDGCEAGTIPVASPSEYRRMCKAMSLCVAFAANVGGIGTLSGTGPNLIMLGIAQGVFHEYGLDSGVNFTSWMVFALPVSILCITLAWVWMSLYFFWPKNIFRRRKDTQHEKDKDTLVRQIIRRQYEKLGPVSFAEKVVIGHFFVMVILWLSRRPPAGTGWGSLFKPKYVSDSATSLLIAMSLFLFPAEMPDFPFLNTGGGRPRSVRAILDWQTVQKSYPWGVLLLMGGGFSLAHVCEVSGLSLWFGQRLATFNYLEPWQLTLVVSTIVALATELTSNAVTATLLLPILTQLAIELSIHPLYLLLPATIATSYAFMLPVSNPPNAIVFATNHLTVTDMIKSGWVLNMLGVLVVNLAINTWGMAYFQLQTLPPEFHAYHLSLNTTAPPILVGNMTSTVGL